jgi:hypothetical protein
MRLQVVMQTLWRGTPLLCSLSTFATYTATDHTLTAAIAFTSLALFDLLQQPAAFFPQVLTSVIDARMSYHHHHSLAMLFYINDATVYD